MKETIINKYLKIEPIKFDSFIQTERQSYEAVGTVLNKDISIDIPIGAKVWFDSFMAKKYPVIGKEGEYDWFIHIDEIVKYDAE